MTQQEDANQCLRDVIALSTLPAIWLGANSLRIAESLAASLFTTLMPTFVYVHFPDPSSGNPTEVAQLDRYQVSSEVAAAVGRPILDWTREHDPYDLLLLPHPGGTGTLRVTTRSVGPHAALGVIAAAFADEASPASMHHLILNVAANQAATAISNAHLLQSLRASERRLAAFLEQLPVGVGLTDPQGRWVVANPLLRRLFGDVLPSRDPMAALRWRSWTADGRLLEPSEYPGARALKGETVPGTDFLCKTDTDGELWTRVNAAPFFNAAGELTGAICVVQNIDARKHAEDALRRSEERFRSLISVITDVPWVADPEGAFIEPQPDWERYTGQDWEKHRQFGWLEAVHPDDRDRIHGVWQQAREQRVLHQCAGRLWHASTNEWRHFEARATPVLNSDGSVREWVGAYTDIEERTRAELALREGEERLRTLASQLEHLVDERTEELRGSQARLRALATELNLTEYRERKKFAQELHDHLAQMLVLGRMKLGQAKRMSDQPPRAESFIDDTIEVLNGALMYTRTLMADLSPPVLQEFGLAAALRWLAEQMKRYDLAVAVDAPENNVPPIREDWAVLLFQSVRELLINISKHAETNAASVMFREQDGSLRLEVRDEGRGFDLAVTDSPSPMSSQFGLFSIRERMKALGGRFEIHSTPGHGTRATLTLPLSTHDAGEILRTEVAGQRLVSPERATPVAAARRPSASEVIRVLLVDDHAVLRQGLRTMVTGYQQLTVIGEANDGLEAIDLASQLKPDVIIMDVNMPRLDGIEATRRIKKIHPDMAIVGLSLHQEPDVEKKMREAGAIAYLTKESAVEDLCRVIETAARRPGRPNC